MNAWNLEHMVMNITNLYQPVQWKPANNEVREVLDDGEAREHHPVRQPFRVVVPLWRFQSLHRHIRRVNEPNGIAYQFSPKPEY